MVKRSASSQSHRCALLSGMCCKDDTIIPVLKGFSAHLQAILPRIRRYRFHKMAVGNKQVNKKFLYEWSVLSFTLPE